MATGACGINCDACKLNVNGICSTCGPGTSTEAKSKIEVQKNVLGRPCPILDCARMNQIEYCLGDCDSFPCENFEEGPYPFSTGFLMMQKRRRKEKPPAVTPQGNVIDPPEHFWDDLKEKTIEDICARSLALPYPPDELILRFLQEEIIIDLNNRALFRLKDKKKEKIENSLLELITLVYLLNVSPALIRNNIVSPEELKEGHFFQGPHELETAKLIKKFGNDIEGFKKSAEKLGGVPLKMANTAYKLLPFPKIPVYYLFWEGDEEFEPKISILFDRSIESHLAADAIWGVVSLASDMLYRI